MERLWAWIRLAWVAVAVFICWDLISNSRASHFGLCLASVPLIGMLWARSGKSRLSKIGICACLAGALSNVAVIMANGGMMPVDRPERVRSVHGDSKHISMQPGSRLKPLADVFYFGGMISSIGDILLTAGVGIGLVGFVIRKLRESSAEQPRSEVVAG
jgi:hypothetical protein